MKTPTLLVISENPSVRFWIKKNLNDDYFIIEEFHRNKVLLTVRNTTLDFILLDGNLEECNPLDLCREIREISQNHWLPILLITGRLKRTFRDQALDAGVTDFLNSQLDLEELETRIATGKKAAQLREKTGDASAILKGSKPQASQTYFKNKLLIHDQALRLLAGAKNKNIPVSLLVLRVDNFEELQSTEGFLVAEQILAECSEIIEEEIKEPHYLMPAGTGTFAILLPNIENKERQTIALHVQKVIQKSQFKGKENPVRLTASIALSSLETNQNSFNKMVDAATKALHQNVTDNLIISLDKEPL